MAVFNILNAWSGRSEWGFLEPLDGSTGWHNAIGACLLVRVEAFLKVGGYKDFFLCFNELDLVLTLWEAGFRVVYDRRWKAFHKRPPSGRNRRFYFEVRNFTATVWTHFDSLPGLVVIANYAARALWEARAQGRAQTVARAVRDGLRLGPRLCSERRGTIPPHVRRLFYLNFLWGRRLARRLPRAGASPGSGSLRTRVRSAD
jgi:GT2 family glycosyltransferase